MDSQSVKYCLLQTRDVKVVNSSTLLLPLLKNEKTTVDTFFLLLWVCSLPSILNHFEETNTHPYIALALPTSLKLIVLNYSALLCC